MTAKQKKKRIERIKDKMKRTSFLSFAIYFFFTSISTFAPLNTFALTGGPSQPEVQSFEPVGTSDMVNLFSGDLTYNIPLLDVDGYPINIAYNGGVTTDQEASWTGLGWNVNVGTINRGLRGLPDDFKDDIVKTETNIKKNWTAGVGAGVDIELFGADPAKALGVSIGFGFGVNYDNFNGVGTDLSFNISSSLAFTERFAGSVGLGMNSSSTGGLSISPSIGLSSKLTSGKNTDTKLGGSIGSSFNSRSGLSSLSIGVNLTVQKSKTITKTNEDGTETTATKKGTETGVGATSASFDFQQPTYTPSITNSMRSFAISGRFKMAGGEVFGTHLGLNLSSNYSQQTLKDKVINSPSYGYLYSETGQNRSDARHDFNRENEGSVTAATPNLALANYTYDIYSVSGQGVGGSYRPFRNQIGFIFDNDASNKSNSIPISVELGFGNVTHVGSEAGVVMVNSTSGKWQDQNLSKPFLSFTNKDNVADFENVVFREANEASVNVDPAYYQLFGENKPVRISLLEAGKFNVFAMPYLTGTSGFTAPLQRNFRKGRVKRNSTIQHLTVGEVRRGYGIGDFMGGSVAANTNIPTAKPHHIGQIISLGNDGLRYVYGQPAYNTTQEEVTFAVGATLGGGTTVAGVDYPKGLVSYTPNVDNSTNNAKGLDNFFQRVTTPAFAHSYLLTAVVSDDYVDADNIKGPSDGDLGTYTKFSYDRIDNYKWRVPVEKNTASYNEGLKSDPNDDKASYLYGEKELFYLNEIETKNFIAIFDTEDRLDGVGVNDANGGVSSGKKMKLLKSIRLYSKPDFIANPSTATPIKVVHFEYDYTLCQGIPNSMNGGGKLTLKKVYFTFRDSQKGKLSPYIFTYKNNFPYHLKAYDRWGNYKPVPTGVSQTQLTTSPLPTFEFPYVDQNKTSADANATAWILSGIDLPSGGHIGVTCEADDYAYVQHKQAMEMAKIVDIQGDPNDASLNTGELLLEDNKKIFFKMQQNATIHDYVGGINDLYFRCLMKFRDGYDYVSGYAKIVGFGTVTTSGGQELGWIQLEGVGFDDNSSNKSPITVAAVQFARLHIPKQAWASPVLQDGNFEFQFVESLLSSLSGFVTGFKNPNSTVAGNGNGKNIVLNKSWIRLNDVDGRKFGGGHRVNRIEITDNWDTQTTSAMPSSTYGQEYNYSLTDGSSSGVASYEPQLGGDENPWKQPVRFSNDKKWAPDDRFFQETPFGESFFPSASVGYSRVVVKNLERKDGSGNKIVTKNATGFVEHTFYTAKDFPTLAKRTEIDPRRHKNGPFSIASLLKIDVKDYFTASQGFVVETNDMHGKQKSQAVYAENQQQPISSVEFKYKQTQGSSAATSELVNNVKYITPNGTVSDGLMGVNFDMVADYRQSKTKVIQTSVNVNVDVFIVLLVPVTTVIPIPSFSKERTQFRSAVLTKVVQKFGVLENTIATDLGSKVETKNLAYDSETGQVLLTETTTNFNDKVYSMNFPAYWHYENMGQAYKNIGFTMAGTINAGVLNSSNAPFFVPGDEVALVNTSNNLKAWVITATNNQVTFQVANGAPPSTGNYVIKVIRSGRRNLTTQMMATVTSLTNPINTIKNNIYENVLQASAIEYTDEWRTFCDCNDNENLIVSTNPYFLGIKGNFKPKISYLHLSSREQSDFNDNTNIRKDGTFESFQPFYKVNNAGKWIIDRKDWTFTSQVTEFNPFGQELENQDALGRFSAATFGFNQTLPKSVAANSRYRETGFTSFEDDNFSDCADNHFKFDQKGVGIINNDAHAGRHSVRVAPNNSATLTRDLADCNKTGCTLSFNLNPAGSILHITVTGNSGQVASGFQVISGSPSVIPTANGFDVVASNGDFVIEFNAIDEEGCQTTNTLTNLNNTVLLSGTN